MNKQQHADTADLQRIAQSEMWQVLDEQSLTALLAAGDTIRLEAGEYLFRPGDRYRQCVHIHLEGDLIQISANGNTRHAEPGDVVGLASYLDGDNYRSQARAESPCRLLSLPAAEIKRLERESPNFFEAINRALAARMRKARQVRETVRGTLARPAHDFMRDGLATCNGDLTIAEATDIMAHRQVGSLAVLDGDGRLLGLVTPMILLSAMTASNVTAEDPISMTEYVHAHSVTQETPLWQVEEALRRHRLRELVVVDEEDLPVGIISQTDLIHALAKPPYTLDAEIKTAQSIQMLARLRTRIPAVARGVHEAHRSVGTAVRALTEMHLALQHRLIELILAQMQQEGLGAPPARFAVIIMGSGGRGEMLLRPDQDNGMIIEDDVDEAGLQWFENLAERLNPALDEIGYRLCPGDVMARNPEYRRTLSGWCEKLSGLIANPGRKEARAANIVLDFATLYGDDSLTSRLRAHFNHEINGGQGKMLFRMMVSDDAKIEPPLGWFNRLITTEHRGSRVIDLKRTGLRIIVDSIRVFALREGVSRCQTHERISALRRLGIFDADFSETMGIAFEELQDLLFSHQLDQIDRGETPDPLLRMERLSSHDRERLRISLRAARRMRERLQLNFGLVLHNR